ncbi:MAG: hypothetical protein ABJB66_13580 [Gemmatimonadaceae bacterium]
MTGNWGSPNSTSAAFALTEFAGQLTGHGWVAPGLPLQITGTRVGENVQLAFTSPLFFSYAGTFRGSFVNDALVGDINGNQRVSLSRVDTVADALAHQIYSAKYPGGAGRAAFYVIGDTLIVQLATVYPLRIAHVGVRITPGSYSIAASPSPVRALIDIGSGVESEVFHAVSGTLIITQSSQRALIGSYTMDMALGTEHISASGSFSAVCVYGYAVSYYQRCPAAN